MLQQQQACAQQAPHDQQQVIWGHSTTTWTNFDPILTPSLSGQLWTFYMIPTYCHVTKRGLSTPPSFFNVVTECPLKKSIQGQKVGLKLALYYLSCNEDD